jgi:hypothetical protein
VSAIGGLEVIAPYGRDRQPTKPPAGTDELGNEVVGGSAEDLGGYVELGESTSDRENRDLVTHPHRLVDVVGDEHDRLVEVA